VAGRGKNIVLFFSYLLKVRKLLPASESLINFSLEKQEKNRKGEAS
jgi:hypothetical protein